MRTRFGLGVILAVGVAAGGLILERVVGPRPIEAATGPAEVSGAWFCPHGGGEGWRTWVVLANPGTDSVDARLVTFRGRGGPILQELTLAPGTHRFVEVSAEQQSSGSSVEFFGASVGAGMVAVRPGVGGLASEPCSPRTGRRWLVPDGWTVRGQESRVVVMNPFGEQAVVDITLVAGADRIRPTRLSGVLIRPRRTASFDLNRFALGRESITADVRTSLGEVAVAGIGSSRQGLRAVLGVPRPTITRVLPGAGGEGASDVSLFVPGRAALPLAIRAQGAEEQATVVPEAMIRGGTGSTLEVEDLQGGLFVEAQAPVPFVAGRRLLALGVDRAATAGAAEVRPRWLALPAVGPDGGGSRLLLQNPGGEDVQARITLLGSGGPIEAPGLAEVTVSAGLTSIIELRPFVGERPVSVVVEAEAGGIAVAQIGRTPSGFALAVGVRLAAG